jgi:hypothetical protein
LIDFEYGVTWVTKDQAVKNGDLAKSRLSCKAEAEDWIAAAAEDWIATQVGSPRENGLDFHKEAARYTIVKRPRVRDWKRC